MNDIFDNITNFVNGVEDSLINLISAVILWMVPTIPAYLTYFHLLVDLKFPKVIAGIGAAVVEFLGLASVRTAIKFWAHNQRYSTQYKRAPFILVIATYVFYIVVVLSVNVILDWGKIEASHEWAIALFSLLSVPSGYLMSARAQHTELERKIADDNAKAAATRKENKQQKKEEEPPKIYASSKRQEIIDLLEVIWQSEHRIAGGKELASRLQLDADTSKSYVWSLTKTWKETHPEIKE